MKLCPAQCWIIWVHNMKVLIKCSNSKSFNVQIFNCGRNLSSQNIRIRAICISRSYPSTISYIVIQSQITIFQFLFFQRLWMKFWLVLITLNRGCFGYTTNNSFIANKIDWFENESQYFLLGIIKQDGVNLAIFMK